MITYQDHCVDCKSMGLPCYGRSCINRHVAHFHCDKCKREVDVLRNYNGDQWCEECILKEFDEVEIDE